MFDVFIRTGFDQFCQLCLKNGAGTKVETSTKMEDFDAIDLDCCLVTRNVQIEIGFGNLTQNAGIWTHSFEEDAGNAQKDAD